MKKAIIFAAITIFSMSVFGQSTKRPEPKKMDSIHVAPVPQRFALLLTQDEWGQLSAVVGSSGKLTGDKISDYLKYLQDRLVLLPNPSDTANSKK
jgi:hypothetical protein